MRYREPAICLRTTDYSETSQVVHFFTRGAGMARLLAKGTKRPKSKSGGMIDLLAEGDLVFSSSGRETLGTLMEFTETHTHGGLRKDAGRLNAALYMIEVTGEMLAEADPHPEAFDLLHNGLARLGQSDSPVGAVLAYFQWRLLQHAGLLGQLESCVSCGRKIGPGERSVCFSSTQGGLVCGDCEGAFGEKYRLDAGAMAGLGVLMAVSSGRRAPLPEDQAKAVNRLLSYHISQQLGKGLRTARHAIG